MLATFLEEKFSYDNIVWCFLSRARKFPSVCDVIIISFVMARTCKCEACMVAACAWLLVPRAVVVVTRDSIIS